MFALRKRFHACLEHLNFPGGAIEHQVLLGGTIFLGTKLHLCQVIF